MSDLPHGYALSDERTDMQVDAIHAFLSTSYWSPGVPLDVVRRAIAGSLCIGIFWKGEQVAFARLITDRATFAYLADVYVLPAHAGKGLASAMLNHLQGLEALSGLRRWILATRDAHSLYARLGWTPLPEPALFMQRHFPNIYETVP